MSTAHSMPEHHVVHEDEAVREIPAPRPGAAADQAAEDDLDVLILEPDQYSTEDAPEPAAETVPDLVPEPPGAIPEPAAARLTSTIFEPATAQPTSTIFTPATAQPTSATAEPDTLAGPDTMAEPPGALAEPDTTPERPGALADQPGGLAEPPDAISEPPGLLADQPGGLAEAPDALADQPGALVEPPGPPPDDAFAADIPPTNPDYRWREIQVMFVDDPRGSVERAAELAADTLRELNTKLRERERDLRSTWQDANADTEELRTSLQGYRALVAWISDLAQHR
jgi:predicted HTH domain antitoxin